MSSLKVTPDQQYLTNDKRYYYVGHSEDLSVDDLRKMNEGLSLSPTGGMKFRTVWGDVYRFIHDEKCTSTIDYGGAVFQAASQFNALEMVSPDVKPSHGIRIYDGDPTQGPACACACPPAVHHRNWVLTQHDDSQIDLAHLIKDLFPEGTFYSKNGYLFLTEEGKGQIEHTFRNHDDRTELLENIQKQYKVFVQWDTAISGQSQPTQSNKDVLKVGQVYLSALPVAYDSR